MKNPATTIAASLCALLSVASLSSAADSSVAEQLFAHQIAPLLESKCLACHGGKPGKVKGGLDLRARKTALRGGDSGAALSPGRAEESLLYQALTWADPDLQMPPKENDRLSAREVALFKEWIDAGAPWPDPQRVSELRAATPDRWQRDEGVAVRTSGGLSEAWTRRRYAPADLWVWQPLNSPRPPVPDEEAIDWFIERKLKAEGIEPQGLADRRALIRRASYDLTGLPPTPEEIAEFLADPDDDERAFARVVDRLLASPHYGEHWGRHWLDVARYADTAGFANDFDRGNAWRYRDYVVRSFNSDKPYSEFIAEQLAGDELGRANPERVVATGFLRMGPWELTSMQVAAVARQQFLDDVVNSVGQSFLGLTLRCAKCHDHKFDPIPTRDYYALYAVFQGTQLTERRTPFFLGENTEGFEEKELLIRQRERVQAELDELHERQRRAEAAWFRERGLPYRSRREAFNAGEQPQNIPPKSLGYTVKDFGRERMARKTLLRLKWKLGRYEPVALAVYNGVTPTRENYMQPMRMPVDPMAEGIPERGHILLGGDVFSKGPPVSPGALSALNESQPELAAIRIPTGFEGRRKALAQWIAHPSNPLTWRSIANRIWGWHFGAPLAGNPNNLGATGKKPTHPELLDWLAVKFRDGGGSFKVMHRLILRSRAWRRAAGSAPHYAAFPPRRLTAEELRDSMLRVSGELNPAVGGIPNRPEINLEVALQPRMVMGTFATVWQPNRLPAQRHRRTIYAMKVRGLRDPFMEVFNAPNPDLSCERRQASTVTPQVFSLFNSQRSYDRAVAFALRLKREQAEHGDPVRRAFELAFGRLPDEEELVAARTHVTKMTERHRGITVARPVYPTEIVRHAVEENTGEPFSFTERIDAFEDFVPDPKLADVDPETRGLAELCLVLFNANEFAYVY